MLVISICLLIVLIEGYDLLLMAFSASSVAAEWSLNGAQIGILLSSVGVGLVLGSAFLAPLADRIGRRPMTLIGLGIIIASMAISAATISMPQLAVARFVTGIGVGGLVAGLPVVISEFSSRRRRATMIAIGTAGLPIGGVVGGFVAAIVLSTLGWRASFLVGAALTIVAFVLVLFALPESIDFLVSKRPKNAVETINRTLKRMNLAPITELPAVRERPKNAIRTAIFTGRNGVRSALLGFAFFVMMAAFYFANGWTPRLLEQAGGSAAQGISAGILLNLGGAAAALLFGVFAIFIKNRLLTIISFAGAAAAFLTMGLAFGSFALTLTLALAVGALIQACATGLFTLAPECYPAEARTTGVGWAVSLGRIGAIISPILAGVLIDRGWTAPSLYMLFALPLVLGGIAIVALRLRPREEAPADAGAAVSAEATSSAVRA
ncbi:MFS transporter [Microbacterium sp. EST19A]|uniref:MFS transporter n=1 Tax=Microbacterium sp. EST19A TaxID=2862681 RepID=UPI001CBC4635|nr:MFS transporter [Microbacterium sp. EST19A]